MKKLYLINMSGGKDSTAMALYFLEQKVENVKYIFADTGNELQLTLDYLDYLETALDIQITRVRADFTEDFERRKTFIKKNWSSEQVEKALPYLKPTGNPFLDMCMSRGIFPSPTKRFCTAALKINPIEEEIITFIDDYDVIYNCQGVRADESRKRADLPVENKHGYFPNVINYRPLLNWTAQDCFDIHKKHKIEPNPLYKNGSKRVGCAPCIYSNAQQTKELFSRFPEEMEKIFYWESMVQKVSTHENPTFMPYDMENVIVSSIEEDDIPSCSSVYGLCE